LDGSFTVAYPGPWGIEEEEARKVTFDIPGPLFLYVSLAEGGGDIFSENDEENIRMHTTMVAEAFSEQHGHTGFRVIDKGVWRSNVYKGYFYEFVTYREVMKDDIPSILRYTTIWVGSDTVATLYSDFLTTEFTADDRETFEVVIRTIRVN